MDNERQQLPVAPTVEKVKKTKASLQKAVMIDVKNFQKYRDPQKFQQYLADNFQANTKQDRKQITASASVRNSLGNFLKSAKKSIPSIFSQGKSIFSRRLVVSMGPT